MQREKNVYSNKSSIKKSAVIFDSQWMESRVLFSLFAFRRGDSPAGRIDHTTWSNLLLVFISWNSFVDELRTNGLKVKRKRTFDDDLWHLELKSLLARKNELLTFNFFFLFPSFPIRFNDYNMFNSLKGFKVPLIFQISLCEKRCVAWDIVFLLFLLDNFLLLFYSMILIIVCNAIALETTTVCLLVEGLSETSAFSFQVTSEKLCFSGSSLCWNSQCLCFTMCN